MPLFSKKAGSPGGESMATSLPMAYSAKRATTKSTSIPSGSSSNLASDSDEHYNSIADAILRQKKSNDPGQVDLEANDAVQGQAPYDDMNSDAFEESPYSDDEESEDSGDMFSAIKRKRR